MDNTDIQDGGSDLSLSCVSVACGVVQAQAVSCKEARHSTTLRVPVAVHSGHLSPQWPHGPRLVKSSRDSRACSLQKILSPISGNQNAGYDRILLSCCSDKGPLSPVWLLLCNDQNACPHVSRLSCKCSCCNTNSAGVQYRLAALHAWQQGTTLPLALRPPRARGTI